MTGKIETGEVVTQQTSRMLPDRTKQPNNGVGGGCNVSRDWYQDVNALEPKVPIWSQPTVFIQIVLPSTFVYWFPGGRATLPELLLAGLHLGFAFRLRPLLAHSRNRVRIRAAACQAQ
jgi:hypothetical protein